MTQKKIIMVAGHANLPQGMAAKSLFGTLAVIAKIEMKYGVIVSASCTLATKEAQDHIASILIGHSLNDGITTLIDEIKTSYFGSAQNALVAALKDLHRSYQTIRSS